jgi:hypothetical protein
MMRRRGRDLPLIGERTTETKVTRTDLQQIDPPRLPPALVTALRG